jgi:hypothetical protein
MKNLKKNNLLNITKFYFSETTPSSTSYNSIKVSTHFDNVGLIQLYRPKAKNAADRSSWITVVWKYGSESMVIANGAFLEPGENTQ